MSRNKTLKDTGNVTSLPESADGPTPCDWQDGRQRLMFGPQVSLVNRFRAPASEWETPTNGTSGPCSTDLSASARLQSSLANRLRQRMDLNGSMEYSLTWKTRVTPAGRPICALRASWHRTSEAGCTGLPTPSAATNTEYAESAEREMTRETNGGGALSKLTVVCHLAGWPTARSTDRGRNRSEEAIAKAKLKGGSSSLEDTVQLTQRERMVQAPETQDHLGTNVSRVTDWQPDLDRPLALAGWTTPMAGSPAKFDETGTKIYNEAGSNDSSRKTLELVSAWPTPAARDFRDCRSNQHGRNARPLNEVAGLTTASSTAATGSLAESVLNPAMSRWLQGYPVAWDQAAPGSNEWNLWQQKLTASDGSGGTETP